MQSQQHGFEIGRVVAVDTAKLTIELHRELKSMARTTFESTQEVGKINSYVVLPVGNRRIVAIVSRIVMTEESELRADRSAVFLPVARRLMIATMIGTIDGEDFRQGVSGFPVLDNPVLLADNQDLDAIFGKSSRPGGEWKPPADAGQPGFCVPIGSAAVSQDRTVSIDPDAFFGKHAAVLGSTGSGKSCTIASVIQSVLSRSKNGRFVILDTNGEYRAAFGVADASENKTLYISTDPQSRGESLKIPYWFMNAEDFVRLFRAAPNVQQPVLMDALLRARTSSVDSGTSWLQMHFGVDLRLLAGVAEEGTWQQRGNAVGICSAMKSFIEGRLANGNNTALEALLRSVLSIEKALQDDPAVRAGDPKYAPVGTGARDQIRRELSAMAGVLAEGDKGGTAPSAQTWTSPDSPRFFSRVDFESLHLERAVGARAVGETRVRENCATLQMRIERLMADPRFSFLFGPRPVGWEKHSHSLATFIRDILGLPSQKKWPLSDEEVLPTGALGYYDRQRRCTAGNEVVVVDLSLLAPEVLENVTALIGRLILEFLQRISNAELSGVARGQLPIVLVLEEAQNYIRERRRFEEDGSIARDVFERIAREGRKYGLGLLLASQRPSELSRTVLSQCSTFIVHRLQNPEDLSYFKDVVPGAFRELLDQLPALAPQYAMVLGEGVRAPALVRVREARPRPYSDDPKFYQHWVDPEPTFPDVEAVCAEWEGEPLP